MIYSLIADFNTRLTITGYWPPSPKASEAKRCGCMGKVHGQGEGEHLFENFVGIKKRTMPNKVLILFAHPRFERSLNNSVLVESIPDTSSITFHDLYEKYPDFNIDIEYEKKLLSEHQVIIWQHPFYWYSSPPLLKQWIDLVLEFGWAYGPGGNALQGKIIFNAITSGGPRSAYSKEGYNRFTVRELLAPFDQTAVLCKMVYLPPFAVHGTHRIGAEEKTILTGLYRLLLEQLVSGDFNSEEAKKHFYLNDWIESKNLKFSI